MTTATDLWFEKWAVGDIDNLPITNDFIHTSPYGTITGKQAYLELVNANQDKFLNHRFEIHETISEKHKTCVRYTAIQEEFRLEVTEWHYIRDNHIHKIIAYYNIAGEISEDRKLKNL